MKTENINKNTIEYTIYDILKQNFGSVNVPIDVKVKEQRLQVALESYEQQVISFRENPSATNWNMMLTVMANYQYWVQKKEE
tara:strand:- start:754 stop:999 length:246 start_codon:yes stop_codon:yes gene_type:complete